MKEHHTTVPVGDLVLVTDLTPREHFGGPLDGEFLPANDPKHYACVTHGFYVPINEYVGGEWVGHGGYQWAPTAPAS